MELRSPLGWLALALAGPAGTACAPHGAPVSATPNARSAAVATANPAPACPAGMALVPGGERKEELACIGSDGIRIKDLPCERLVTMPAQCFDVFEVTNRRYEECVDALVCDPPASCRYDGNTGLQCAYSEGGAKDHPVVVVWNQAATYCAWRRARLPTRVEWAWAAGGNGERRFPWGNEAPTREGVCWQRTQAQGTCPVGSRAQDRTPAGLFDLAGNVSEWVYYVPQPLERFDQAIQGGDFDEDIDAFIRSQHGRIELERHALAGFRCALNASPGLPRESPRATPTVE